MKTLLLFLTLTATAQAAPIDRILGGYEHVPTADEARSVGAQALIDYAEDARHPQARRIQAIAALRFVPCDAARVYAVDVLARLGRSVAGGAVLEVAAALTALAPYHRSELIIPYATHASADVRQSAAASLALIADPPSLSVLRTRLIAERDPGLRAFLLKITTRSP